jgi:hypothetical protein
MNSAPLMGSSGPVSKVICSADVSLRTVHLSGYRSDDGGYAPGASRFTKSAGISGQTSSSLAAAAAYDDPFPRLSLDAAAPRLFDDGELEDLLDGIRTQADNTRATGRANSNARFMVPSCFLLKAPRIACV